MSATNKGRKRKTGGNGNEVEVGTRIQSLLRMRNGMEGG